MASMRWRGWLSRVARIFRPRARRGGLEVADFGEGKSYGDSRDNNTSGFVEIDVSHLDPGVGTTIPFRLVTIRFESSSPDSESFIHDPLTFITNKLGGEVKNLDGSTSNAFEGVDSTWHVVTTVANHQRTLSIKNVNAVVSVIPNGTLAITLIKGTAT